MRALLKPNASTGMLKGILFLCIGAAVATKCGRCPQGESTCADKCTEICKRDGQAFFTNEMWPTPAGYTGGEGLKAGQGPPPSQCPVDTFKTATGFGACTACEKGKTTVKVGAVCGIGQTFCSPPSSKGSQGKPCTGCGADTWGDCFNTNTDDPAQSVKKCALSAHCAGSSVCGISAASQSTKIKTSGNGGCWPTQNHRGRGSTAATECQNTEYNPCPKIANPVDASKPEVQTFRVTAGSSGDCHQTSADASGDCSALILGPSGKVSDGIRKYCVSASPAGYANGVPCPVDTFKTAAGPAAWYFKTHCTACASGEGTSGKTGSTAATACTKKPSIQCPNIPIQGTNTVGKVCVPSPCASDVCRQGKGECSYLITAYNMIICSGACGTDDGKGGKIAGDGCVVPQWSACTCALPVPQVRTGYALPGPSGKATTETRPCKLDKPCSGVDISDPAKVKLALSGAGLLDKIKAASLSANDKELFTKALILDIATTLGVAPAMITIDMLAILAASSLLGSLLAADQTVDVPFVIKQGASNSLTPVQLAKYFSSVVNDGTAKFVTSQAMVSFTAKVTGFEAMTKTAAGTTGGSTTGTTGGSTTGTPAPDTLWSPWSPCNCEKPVDNIRTRMLDGKAVKEARPCQLDKPCPGVADAERARVKLALTGPGLWDWIKKNEAPFKKAMKIDISSTLRIQKEKILNLAAKLAAMLLLNAEQTVDVEFTIEQGASNALTPAQLAESYSSAVANGTANFSSTQDVSGIEFTAKVSGVETAPAGSSSAVIAIVVVLLVVAAAVAVFFILKKKPAKVAAVKPAKVADASATVSDRDELQRSFDAFDTDKNGELNKEEFRVVMGMTKEGEENSALTDVEFETLFSEVDKDGSGSISFDEYYAWSTSTKANI